MFSTYSIAKFFLANASHSSTNYSLCNDVLLHFLNFWIFSNSEEMFQDKNKWSIQFWSHSGKNFCIQFWSFSFLQLLWKEGCILNMELAAGIRSPILSPVSLVCSHNRRIYHQEVLNLAAPDFLFWENQLALPQLNRFLSDERGCLLVHLFSLALFWTFHIISELR